MTGRSDSDKIDPDRGNNTSGRLLFGAALIFAVGSTLTLVFATNSQWLKLAVIAALWAAFFPAMLSVKYRHQAAARAGEVADLQAVYELELEREVAARREYELEIEADTRRRIAAENEDSSREDIADLRTELRALRENLDRLTGGEVLVERFALRAQSTRMRAIGDPLAAPAITAAPAANRAPARTVDAVLDPSTELFEPAPRPQRADPTRRPGPQRANSQRSDGQRPERQRPDGSRTDSQRMYRLDSQRADQPVDRPRRDELTGQQRRIEPPRVPTQATGEQSRTNLRRDPINPPMPRQPGTTGANPIMVRAAANAGPNPIVGPPNGNSGAFPIGGRYPGATGSNPMPTPFAASVARQTAGARPTAGASQAMSNPAMRSHGMPSQETPSQETPSYAAAGHRRATEADGYAEDSFDQGGRHGSGSYEPVPRPVAMSATPAYASAGARSGGRRAEPEPAGAHTAGRSVTELIAAHTSAEDGPRRHRRRAD